MSELQKIQEALPAKGLFIAGTDTDVGKTYVACRILESLVASGEQAGAYKPVASGVTNREQSDAYQLFVASSQRGSIDSVNPQCFAAPLAPPIAAEMEHRTVDDAQIVQGAMAWRGHCDLLVVEGAGGLLSPISWTMTNAEAARIFGYPVVLVAANRLGVVNHVLSSVLIAQSYGLSIRSIVLNEADTRSSDAAAESNQRLIEVFLARLGVSIPILRLCYSSNAFEPIPNWQ
jgi:dethiobiotin synthetase